MSDEYFLVRGRLFLEMCFYVSLICTISCSHNVLNEINIISAAAGLWGINVIDKYFHVRERVMLGDVLFLSPILHNFHLCGKNRKTNKQTV